MLVVSDTSPIANLIVVKRVKLLESLFDKVIIPQKVYTEILELEKFNIDLLEFKTFKWIEVDSIKDKRLFHTLTEQLDEGEAEAIVLAGELHAQYLLMDETNGREIAEQYGIKTVGLLGVLLQAKEKNLIQEVKPVLDELINIAGFWIGKDLYNNVLKIANENYIR